jgi:hypothetical protein
MSVSLIPIVDSNKYLSDIKSANLLSNALSIRVQELLPELLHNIETQVTWRTETEIRCSVLNDANHPDNAAKYHQCKLEQMVFFEQLLHLSFEYRKLQQDISIIEANIEELDDKLSKPNKPHFPFEALKPYEVKKYTAEREKLKIDLENQAYAVHSMQKQAKERMREIEIWSKLKAEFDDGSFDKDNKDTNQLLSMTRRYVIEGYNAIMIGKNGDISSYNNIVAQFRMLVKECVLRGVFGEMIGYFDSNIYQWVVKECGLVVT